MVLRNCSNVAKRKATISSFLGPSSFQRTQSIDVRIDIDLHINTYYIYLCVFGRVDVCEYTCMYESKGRVCP